MFTSTCPIYPRFRLYNPILGFYDFLVNPSQYTPYPAKLSKVYSTIMDFDPTVDQDYCKIKIEMQWDFMPEQMWMDLEPYFRKNFDGSSLELYLWDWDRFTGARIQVCEFRAGTKGGYSPVDRNNVKLVFRKISNADIYGILANYKFKGNGNDSSLNGNNLTQVGNVPYSIINGAYAAGPFSTSNYFALDKTLLQGRSVWSMVIRFTSDNTTAATQRIYHWYDGAGNQWALQKAVTSGNLLWYFGNGATGISVFSALPAGEHKAVIIGNGTFSAIWIDGNLRASVNTANPISASLVYDAGIGTQSGTTHTQPWLGTISSLRLYSRALTDYELATPLSDNVAYYGMQQSGADWSTQKNHLTTVGNVPYALQSDGTYAAGPFSTSNYFNIATAVATAIGNAAGFTVSGWYYYSAQSESLLDIFLDSSKRINMQIDSTGRVLLLCGSTVQSASRSVDNSWHYLAAVNNGSVTTIYDNGNTIASGNATKPIFTPTASRIGLNTTGTNPLDGYLRNYKLFTRALTPAEIAADYAASFQPALTGSEVAISSTGDELTGDNYDANITKFRNSLL